MPRYQWWKPGDIDRLDTKPLAQFERVSHHTTGDRHQDCSWGANYEKMHIAIHDATSRAHVEVLPDKQMATTVGFYARFVG